jgi:hypothetical protein
MTIVAGGFKGGTQYLTHFTNTAVLSFTSALTSEHGVLIQGRVWIHNLDNGYQKFQVWLTYNYPAATTDYIERRLPPGYDEWVTLYGWVPYNWPINVLVELRCATSNGEAGDPRVIITAVDEFKLIKYTDSTGKVVDAKPVSVP